MKVKNIEEAKEELNNKVMEPEAAIAIRGLRELVYNIPGVEVVLVENERDKFGLKL